MAGRMIAVMTMNTGFFVAVLVGYLFGELGFGRVQGSGGSRPGSS